jgi:hypothetical protein
LLSKHPLLKYHEVVAVATVNQEPPNAATLQRRAGRSDVKVKGNKGIQMPRKKQNDETLLEEPSISDTTDISKTKQARSAARLSTEDMPFAEIIAETEGDDERVDAPYFVEADFEPVSTPAPDSDALDEAIQEARAHRRPRQDKPAHSPAITYEQPALLAIPGRELSQPEMAPPPPVVLAAVGFMLISLLSLAFK